LDGTGNLAAPPGSSNHEGGAAADVELTPKQRELAGQFGLGFPVAGEDWHIELVGDAANQIVTGLGGAGSAGIGGSSGLGDPGVPAASSSQDRRTAGLGDYTGGIDSGTLPQAYLDLIMGATEPGDTGLLDEFVKGRR
jgi:hypothetical protein